MEKIDKFENKDSWSNWVNKQITKHSNKPFKGGSWTATVVELTTNPYSGKEAFKLDNDSVVDCHQTKLVQ